MQKMLRGAIVLVAFLQMFSGAAHVYAQTAERNTAVRYFNSGMEQLKARDYQAARDSFEQALRYDDASAAAHLGLGVSFFHLRDDKYAERELMRAAELDPRDATVYQVLGELFYRKDDLEAAVSFWEKAVELNPGATDTRARLERIRKEHRTEKDFNRDVTSHFLVKYEGREKIEAGRIILRILEDAYGTVGRALSLYPDSELQVILYSGKEFQEVTDAPGWSGGVYDGKIRIPIGGIEQETPGLRRLLYHEYTHAVVRSLTMRCPTWLNEGLAQYFEGGDIDSRKQEMLKRTAQAGKLPSLAALEGSFMGLGNAQAQNAYLFSLSSVRYMVDSFGMYRVKTVLEELGKGADTGKALSSGIMISYDEFERGWKQSLEQP
jgi:tetratricopeptide (TPR) repeat protein